MEPGTYAEFDTTEGSFTVRLFEKEVPKTVANFVGLAEGTKEWRDPSTGEKRRPRTTTASSFIASSTAS